MTRRQVLLGVDIGTSGAKGVLVTAAGQIVARAASTHDVASPHPGWYEQDAESVWWTSLRSVLAQLLDGRAGTEIVAVAVSGIGPCLLPADATGSPLRPAILYGIDTRAQPQITRLTAELGAEQIRWTCGSALTSQAVGPKLAWLREQEPSVYARTAMMLGCSSFLVHKLTGSYVLDHHSASQCAPLYDLVGQRWRQDWCEHIAPGLPMPQLRWPGEIAGTVTAAAAWDTGLAEGTPVITGTIDAWAEAVSIGVKQPGEVMLMYGTTMFLIQALAAVSRLDGLWTTAGVWPDSYTLAAGMATSGALTTWLSDLTSARLGTLIDEAERSPAGANGLLMLPYFAGERTPIFDPDARGAILGLTLRHSRGDIFRSVLEATAFGVRHNLEAMAEAAGAPAGRLVAVGGGTQASLWTQIVSDVTGLPQDLPVETVGACLGDAMLAATAIGLPVRQDEWNPCSSTVQPDTGLADLYDQCYADYRELYQTTRQVTHRLAARQAAD